MTAPDEPCRRCETPLEAVDDDDARDLKSGKVVGHVVRFLCPGCQARGSIVYHNGSVSHRMGPAVQAGYTVRTDERREPAPRVDHGAVATDGGALADD